MGHDEESGTRGECGRRGMTCVRAGSATRSCGRRGEGSAGRGGGGAACGGAAIQNSETSEREAAGARPGRFRASFFVGLTEADENSGRSMTYFCRPG
jgi:hypothetical protein